jgi:hypothetical protein
MLESVQPDSALNIHPGARFGGHENVGWMNLVTSILGVDWARSDRHRGQFRCDVCAENAGRFNLYDMGHDVATPGGDIIATTST